MLNMTGTCLEYNIRHFSRTAKFLGVEKIQLSMIIYDLSEIIYQEAVNEIFCTFFTHWFNSSVLVSASFHFRSQFDLLNIIYMNFFCFFAGGRVLKEQLRKLFFNPLFINVILFKKIDMTHQIRMTFLNIEIKILIFCVYFKLLKVNINISFYKTACK